MSSVHVGVVYSRIRRDEKRLLRAVRDSGHGVSKIDVRDVAFGLGSATSGGENPFAACDVVLDRCLASSRSEYLTTFCDHYGVPIVNGPATARVCADKVATSLALADAGVPTPETTVAVDRETALAVADRYGYPCVLKPVVGSWGRLVAKLDSEAAARAVLEHKETLGHYEHGVFYLQQFIDKPGRDLRVLTAGGEPIAGMARTSDDWRTNAARGGACVPFEVDAEAARLARAAADAVGGGLLGVDLMETGDGYTVHEVNHTVEFAALDDAVARDVPGAIVEWLTGVAGS